MNRVGSEGQDSAADELACILGALLQLRLEHGNHPCYDAIERSATARQEQLLARIEEVGQLRGALRAVVAVASDGLL